jgi:hypothetical protein
LIQPDSGLLCLSGNEEQAELECLEGWRTVLHAPTATFVHGRPNGGMAVNMAHVKEVVVGKNARTTTFEVAVCGGGVMRSVWFSGGGEFHALFGWDGCLIELCGEAIKVTACVRRLTIEPASSA